MLDTCHLRFLDLEVYLAPNPVYEFINVFFNLHVALNDSDVPDTAKSLLGFLIGFSHRSGPIFFACADKFNRFIDWNYSSNPFMFVLSLFCGIIF